MNRRRCIVFGLALALVIGTSCMASAASQDKYALPEPYLAWEKAYLKEFPELQGLMDVMIATATQTTVTAGVVHRRSRKRSQEPERAV